MKITLIKQLNNTFKIAYNSDYETAKKIPLNEPVEFEFTKKRNIRFHNKFMALINLVYQNQEMYNNFEHLRKEIIICSGHYDLIFDLETGEQKKEAQSIKFSKMDDNEFEILYNDVVEIIIHKFNFGKEDIINNIEQYF